VRLSPSKRSLCRLHTREMRELVGTSLALLRDGSICNPAKARKVQILQCFARDPLFARKTDWIARCTGKARMRATRTDAGFTIVEVLVALALLATTAAGMAGLFAATMIATRRAQEQTVEHYRRFIAADR